MIEHKVNQFGLACYFQSLASSVTLKLDHFFWSHVFRESAKFQSSPGVSSFQWNGFQMSELNICERIS